MKDIKDNFSLNATNYASFRPTPPDELYEFLYGKVEQFNTAWDCGTGNGQIAIHLVDKFKKVIATDISARQIELAEKKENIIYLVERAEQSSLQDNSTDLITVAQAVHWFDFNAFNKEVMRVAKNNAIIALITYYIPKFGESVDKIIDQLYWNITRKYWDNERQYVDDKYKTIPFPFDEFTVPEMEIVLHWNLEHTLGYLRTWSGVQHYIKQNNEDPVSMVEPGLKEIWNANEIKEVKFPLFIRAGRIVK